MVPVAVKRESVLVSRLFESERIVGESFLRIMESVVSFGTTLGSYTPASTRCMEQPYYTMPLPRSGVVVICLLDSCLATGPPGPGPGRDRYRWDPSRRLVEAPVIITWHVPVLVPAWCV